MERPTVKYSRLAMVLLALAVVVLTPTASDPLDPELSGQDGYQYLRMVEEAPRDGISPAAAPFCYRVLVPAMARALPGSTTTSAFAVHVFFLVVLALLLHQFLLAHGRSPWIAAIASALVLLTGNVRWAFHAFYLTDIPGLAFLTLGLILLRAQKLRLFSVLLCVAVLNREVAIGLAASMFLHQRFVAGVSWGRAFRQTVLAAAPAVLTVVAVRLWITPARGPCTMDLLISPAFRLSVDAIASIVIRPFGALLLLAAFVRVDRLPEFARRHPAELILALEALGHVILAHDTQRMMLFAMPCMLLLATTSLPVARWTTVRSATAGVLLVLFQYVFYLTNYRDVFVIAGLDYHRVKTLASLVLMAVAAGIAAWTQRELLPLHRTRRAG